MVTDAAASCILGRPPFSLRVWPPRYQTGIGGLQSVVLYALPELDGAIDAIPLGGLCCGDKEFCNANRDLVNCNREGGEIRLVQERLTRLTVPGPPLRLCRSFAAPTCTWAGWHGSVGGLVGCNGGVAKRERTRSGSMQ